jgi:serine/threonine protein kinase
MHSVMHSSIGEVQLLPTPSIPVYPSGVAYRKSWTLGDFCHVQNLSKSAGASVSEAREIVSGQAVAIKKISKAYCIRNHTMEDTMREITLHTNLSHPNVVPLLCWFHDPQFVYMVMERGDCTLSDLLRSKYAEGIPPPILRRVALQLLRGLSYLHSLNVVHRDIKPSNIFLSSGVVKIGDFGCSVHTPPHALRQSVQGSVPYMSPEIISGPGHSFPSDIWSLGVTLYELSTGRLPFDGDTPQQIFRRIVSGIYDDGGVVEEVGQIVRLCLQKDPAVRPSAENLLNQLSNSNR